jgi:hypothetical protein
MDRTSGTNYTTDGDGNRIFTNGPPGTRVEEDWLNGVQEEIVGMIEETGQTPDDSDSTQLKQAIMSGLSSVFTPSVRLVWKDVNTITVQAGWYFVGGTYIRQLAASLDWTWTAAGQNRGLLGGGPEAVSTWYYLYGILYNDAFAVVADDNTPPTSRFNTAIMPLVPTHSYNTNIYLGAFYNDAGSDINRFTQVGNCFYWDLDGDHSSVTHTGDVLLTSKTIRVPTTAIVMKGALLSNGAGVNAYAGPNSADHYITLRVPNANGSISVEIPIETAQTMYIGIANGANTVTLETKAWIDKYL